MIFGPVPGAGRSMTFGPFVRAVAGASLASGACSAGVSCSSVAGACSAGGAWRACGGGAAGVSAGAGLLGHQRLLGRRGGLRLGGRGGLLAHGRLLGRALRGRGLGRRGLAGLRLAGLRRRLSRGLRRLAGGRLTLRRRGRARGGRRRGARRHRRTRELVLLAARGDLQRRAVGLEDAARALLRRGALRGRAGRGAGTLLGRGARALRRCCALLRSGGGGGAGRGLGGSRAVAAERAQGVGLVHGGRGSGHVEACIAQLREHVRTGHALFLRDLVDALLGHQLIDSTRSSPTDTARRNARCRARRSIAPRAHAASHT
jgi:hypothetical protein